MKASTIPYLRSAPFAALCAALAFAAPAVAGTPIDQTRPLKADGQLHVKNVHGLIEVSTWDRDEVQVSGELGDDAEELSIEGDANRLVIEVRSPSRSGYQDPSILQIKVPVAAAIHADSLSADVDVRGTSGPLTANTVSGDLRLSSRSEQVEANSVSGDISLEAPSRSTRLNSVSGDVSAEGLIGTLVLETVSGNAELSGGPFVSLELRTISGDLQAEVSLAPEATVIGDSLSGNLNLQLAASTSALVSIKSFSGDVSSSLGGEASGDADERRLEVRVGDGRGRIDLSSFSGDIAVTSR